MNIGYIIDLSKVLSEQDLHIPHLEGLFYRSINPADLEVSGVLDLRTEVMKIVKGAVEKHLFFFVLQNDKDALLSLSKCIDGIQADEQHFDKIDNEIHIICNFLDGESGFSIVEYEKRMRCLTNNNVCVYTWLLEEFDHGGARQITGERRTHSIARLVWMLCAHYQELMTSLRPMTQSSTNAKPIYNLFGDASVFFEEGKRNEAVRNYYCYKNLQQLLNLPDQKLDQYLADHVYPYREDNNLLDIRIDETVENFLKEERTPIEASFITEKTQGLLVKSSEDDKEFLIDAVDKKIVFLEDLSKSCKWQLGGNGMDKFLSGFQNRTGIVTEIQEVVSDEFVEQLRDMVTAHEHNTFTSINNVISESQKQHVDAFKLKVDKHLYGFLTQQARGNYSVLFETLPSRETAQHHSNIDCGIAFMEYLESGKGEYLVDQTVSMADTNFTKIYEALEKEGVTRFKEYEEKFADFEMTYHPQGDEKVSKIRQKFANADDKIKECAKRKHECDYQLDHWIDTDSEKKLTAKFRMTIALASGIIAAILWLVVSMKYLSGFMKDIFEHYGRFQWSVFSAFVLAGIAVFASILIRALRRRKEAEEALEDARQKKRDLMGQCVKSMQDLAEKHFNHLLAFYGLKTMTDLIDYAVWKKEDLVYFRKTLFKLMVRYRLLCEEKKLIMPYDENTIELADKDVGLILFGEESKKNIIPFCFAEGGVALSDTFNEFNRNKARLETSRISLGHTSKKFDQTALEKEVVACMDKHKNADIKYSPLKEKSILPNDEKGVEMDDIHQGSCGDCYFMATLAAIAKMKPDYFIGEEGMVEELGEEHRFFRVYFYDKDGQRVSVDVDNRFWIDANGQPIYAKQGISNDPEGSSYDPWVMAIEKAWAKTNNNGYEGIRGTSESKERVRKVEYSFAVTGQSAFYCKTQSVPDHEKLLQMMKKHFLEDHLPITLYSADKDDNSFKKKDDNVVSNHAYALRAIHIDSNTTTFDIFNPWNDPQKDKGYGKHFENVDINFIKNNFDVVVFFGIKEDKFNSFERDLTDNVSVDEVTKDIEKVLFEAFDGLGLVMNTFDQLLTNDEIQRTLNNSIYLFSRYRIRNIVDNEVSQHLMFMEGGKEGICDAANDKMLQFIQTNLPADVGLQPMLRRDDEHQHITLFRLSPHYVLENFR